VTNLVAILPLLSALPFLAVVLAGVCYYRNDEGQHQTWEVDLDRGDARISGSTWRQVSKTAPRLNVAPLVAEVIQAVKAETDDARLKWSPDRSVVTIRIGEIIGPGFAQTVAGRRRRFADRLGMEMADMGWVGVAGKSHTYRRIEARASVSHSRGSAQAGRRRVDALS
jgi:hypothetical protein